MEQVPREELAASEDCAAPKELAATASPAAAPQGLETEASDGVVASAAYLAGKLAVGRGAQAAKVQLLSAFRMLPGESRDAKSLQSAFDELVRTTSLKELLAYYGDATVPEVEVEVLSAEDEEKKTYLEGYFEDFVGNVRFEKQRVLKELGVVLKSTSKTKQGNAFATVLANKTLLELKIACGDAEPPAVEGAIAGTVDIKRKGDTQWQRFSCPAAAAWAFDIDPRVVSALANDKARTLYHDYLARFVTDELRVAADVVLGNEDGYEDGYGGAPRCLTDAALAAAEVDARAAATAERDAFEEARRGRIDALLRIKRTPSSLERAVDDGENGDGENGGRGARRAASAAGKAAAEAELVRRRAAGTAAYKALRDGFRAERKATVEAVLEAYRPARA
jgi:hypothetical protein